MKKNILLLTPVFEMGGTESYILTVANALKEEFNIKVLSGGGRREGELKKIGIEHEKCDCLRKRNLFNIVRGIYEVMKYIKSNKIDIVHTSSVYTTIIAKIAIILSLNIKAKVVITLHGGPNKKIEKNSAKILNLFADKVIALSNNSKNKLIDNGMKEGNICVIYNGIDKLRKIYKKNNSGKVIIGSCGRLTEQKGFDYLIEAIALIKRNDIECWIIGDGELKESFEEKISRMNLKTKIKLLGFRENIGELINEMDIFILPSLWEQFPISILEAMSLGKAIIATDVNGVKEEIKDCGILVKPADVLEIKNNLELLINNKALVSNLGEKSEKRFNKYFLSTIMVDKLRKVYCKL